MDLKPISILHLEDIQEDHELITATVGEEGLECHWERVEGKREFIERLQTGSFDIVLADYNLPAFSGSEALKITLEMQPATPVIIVSGTLDEDASIEMMREGATDYVLKQNLTRLVPAILRAIREAEEHNKRIEIENFNRSITQSANDTIICIDSKGKVVLWNRAAETMFGYSAEEMATKSLLDIIPTYHKAGHQAGLQRIAAGEPEKLIGSTIEITALRKDGLEFPIELSLSCWNREAQQFFTGIIRDITDRKQTEEALRKKTLELETLLHSSEDLAVVGDKQGIFNTLRYVISKNMPCDNMSVSRLDPETDLIHAEFYWMDGVAQDVASLPPLSVNRDGKGTQSQVIVTGESLVMNDYLAQAKTSKTSFFVSSAGEVIDHGEVPENEDVTRSAVLIPIKLEDKTIGVFQVMSYQPNAYTKDHLNLAEAMLGQVAVALKNAELLERLRLELLERKQAEEALRESEEKYRQLYEFNRMPISIFDIKSLKFLSVNNAFIEKYGYTKEEFLKMTVLDIRPESEIGRLKASVNATDAGLVNAGVYLHKKKNGEIIHVEIIRYDLVYEGKNAKLVFANDITERIQAEEKRDIHIAELKLINDIAIRLNKEENIENLSDIIGTTIHSVNPKCIVAISIYDEKVKGVRVRSICGLGKNYGRMARAFGRDPKKMIFDPKKLDQAYEHYTTGRLIKVEGGLAELMDGQVPRMQCRLAEKLMGIQAVYTVGFASGEMAKGGVVIFVPHGTEILFVNTIETIMAHASEIIQKRQMTEALAASEKNYRSVVQDQTEYILRYLPDGTCTFVNDSYCRAFNTTPELAIGRNIMEDLSEAEAQRIKNKISALSLETSAISDDHLTTAVDGTPVWHFWTDRALFNEDGVITEIQGVGRDITVRKQAEAEREQALQEARTANAVKDQFMANISHEIRTPLNSILGFSDLLTQRYSEKFSEKDREIFGHITNSSNRLMNTVDSILNISLLDAGAVPLRPSELDLTVITRQVVDLLKLQAQDKNLDLKLSSSKRPVRIFADEYSVFQAILNLTNNAIKYTFEGSVELKLGHQEDHVTLSIIDTGIGISKEYRERIYDPYTQESEGYTKSFQGIGLGLALVKRYCKRNNIKLVLKSKKGAGTTFKMIFPTWKGETLV